MPAYRTRMNMVMMIADDGTVTGIDETGISLPDRVSRQTKARRKVLVTKKIAPGGGSDLLWPLAGAIIFHEMVDASPRELSRRIEN